MEWIKLLKNLFFRESREYLNLAALALLTICAVFLIQIISVMLFGDGKIDHISISIDLPMISK